METQSTTPQARPFNLQTRVVNILTKPKQEWAVIAGEPKDVAGLYKNYIALLAAIPVVCMAIGWSVIGISMPFVGHYRVSFGTAFANAVIQYVLTLVGVYVAAFIVAKLAPNFQSEPDVAQAVKLVAYSWTAVWVAGVLYLVPALSILVMLAALYCIYLMYLGFTPLMKTPPDKVVVYLVVSAIVAIVVFFVIGVIATLIMPIGMAVPRATF